MDDSRQADLQVFKLQDVFIFKKARHSNFFYTTNDSFAIPIFNFSATIKFMLFRKLLSPKVLQEILDEYNNATS
jgi:hypothetical protein